MTARRQITEEEFGCTEWPLHYACRTGNLPNVQYLVEQAKYSVNQQDRNDCTPLYLAALTGRNEICQFLLKSGAKCDPNSGGDAARVFYVALTPELRNLLREWNLTAASRDPFLDLIRSSLNDATHADCYVTISDDDMPPTQVYLHRIVLLFRCPRFLDYMDDDSSSQSKQESNEEKSCKLEIRLPIKHASCGRAMNCLLEYLYTGILETREYSTSLIVHDMARYYRLASLEGSLQKRLEKMAAKYSFDQDNKVKDSSMRCRVALVHILQNDLKRLARMVSTPLEDPYSPLYELRGKWTAEQVLEWSNGTLLCYPSTFCVHSFVICRQSDYFASALQGNFREAQEATLDLSMMAPNAHVVKLALEWMYSDAFLTSPIHVETAIQLLELGSAWLCPRLCAHVAQVVLVPNTQFVNVFEMHELAKLYQIEKLEDACVLVMAQNLQQIAETTHARNAFKSLIQREALDIRQGGDLSVTDVPVVAEITSALRSMNQANSQMDLLRSIVNEAMATPLPKVNEEPVSKFFFCAPFECLDVKEYIHDYL